MEKQDIPFLSATQLSRLIQSKEVSPIEATEAYLDRIEQVDGKLNSYITVCREEALKSAQEAEQEITAGRYLGPLHGVPVAVKDQFYTKGIRTTAGSNLMWDFVPDHDATVVSGLKNAGAVLLPLPCRTRAGRGTWPATPSTDSHHSPQLCPRRARRRPASTAGLPRALRRALARLASGQRPELALQRCRAGQRANDLSLSVSSGTACPALSASESIEPAGSSMANRTGSLASSPRTSPKMSA